MTRFFSVDQWRLLRFAGTMAVRPRNAWRSAVRSEDGACGPARSQCFSTSPTGALVPAWTAMPPGCSNGRADAVQRNASRPLPRQEMMPAFLPRRRANPPADRGRAGPRPPALPKHAPRLTSRSTCLFALCRPRKKKTGCWGNTYRSMNTIFCSSSHTWAGIPKLRRSAE